MHRASYRFMPLCGITETLSDVESVRVVHVYHNVPSKNRQAILLETLRTLKKGGTFAIHDIMSKGKYGDMESFANIILQDVRLKLLQEKTDILRFFLFAVILIILL